MKKLLLAITLILCLAMALVAFTSCGGDGEDDGCNHTWTAEATVDKAATCTTAGAKSVKCTICGEKKEGSDVVVPALGHEYDDGITVEATCVTDGSVTKTCAICGDVTVTRIPSAGDHTWMDEATVDFEPTCSFEGVKSIKCTVCFTIKTGSLEILPTNDEHSWADAPTYNEAPSCTAGGTESIKCTACNAEKPGTASSVAALGHSGLEILIAPTIFSEGLKRGTCDRCENEISETIERTTPIVEAMTGEDIGVNKKYNVVDEILNGDHFYPTEQNPNGKDLFIEFSMLWNPTLANVSYGFMEIGSLCTTANFDGRMTPYYLNFRDGVKDQWCQFEGGFEPSAPGSEGIYLGPTMHKNGAESDYPYIGEYGWHRIGVQIHQDAYIENGEVVYKATTSLYIDGVKVSSYHFNLNKVADDRLFSAEIVDGELVYSDLSDSIYVVAYRIANGKAPDADAYFVVGDLFVTCGTDFVMKVDAVADPEDATYNVAEGVDLPGKAYFEVACNHALAELDDVVVATLFNTGIKEGDCPTCGEHISVEVPVIVSMNAFDNTSKEDKFFFTESARVGDVLGDNKLYGENSVDVYIEFSILLNETMEKYGASDFTIGGVYKSAKLIGTNAGDGFYYLYLNNQSYMPKGSFEIWNSRCDKVTNGYIYGPHCDGEGDDIYVGNFDGWHRLGMKMHFDAHANGSSVYYTNTVTLYLDGVRIHEYIMRTDDDLAAQSVLTALSATASGGKITSCQNNDDRYFAIYKFTPFVSGRYDGETCYFPIADAYISCDGFKMDVEPVANPEAKTFTQDGVSFSGKMYYQLKTAE